MTVLRGNNGRVELHSDQTLVCEVEIIREIDVPVTVEIEWDLPPFFSDETKASISDTSGSGFSYSSMITISSFTLKESGNYSCTGSVTPVKTGSHGRVVTDKTVSTMVVIQLRTHGKDLT